MVSPFYLFSHYRNCSELTSKILRIFRLFYEILLTPNSFTLAKKEEGVNQQIPLFLKRQLSDYFTVSEMYISPSRP